MPKKTSARAQPKARAKANTGARTKTDKTEMTGGPSSSGQGAGSPPKVPFPRKGRPPSETEFLARLPLPVGKKFEAVRSYIKKQDGVAEDLYFYGPKTGWAFRYLLGAHSLATIMIHDGHLLGIVAMEADVLAGVDFDRLSPIAQRARALAHGSPSLLWLDLPLEGTGAADFKALLKAKLKGGPTPAPEPATPPRSRQPPPPPPPPRRAR